MLRNRRQVRQIDPVQRSAARAAWVAVAVALIGTAVSGFFAWRADRTAQRLVTVQLQDRIPLVTIDAKYMRRLSLEHDQDLIGRIVESWNMTKVAGSFMTPEKYNEYRRQSSRWSVVHRLYRLTIVNKRPSPVSLRAFRTTECTVVYPNNSTNVFAPSISSVVAVAADGTSVTPDPTVTVLANETLTLDVVTKEFAFPKIDILRDMEDETKRIMAEAGSPMETEQPAVSHTETVKGVHAETIGLAQFWTLTRPDPENGGTTETHGLTFTQEIASQGTKTITRIKILTSVFEKRYLYRGKVMNVRFAATDNLGTDVLSSVVTSAEGFFW